MAQNTKDSTTKNVSAAKHNPVKDYSNSPYVVKKTEAAREILQKFPVPEKYWK